MFRHHLQFLKYSWNVSNHHILTISVYNISKSIKYLFIYKTISES